MDNSRDDSGNNLEANDCQRIPGKDDFQKSLQAMLKMEVSTVTRSVHETSSELKQDIGGIKHDIRALRNEISEVKQKCSDIGNKCEHLEKVYSAIETKVTRTEDKLSSLEERYDSMCDSVETVLSNSKDLTDRIKALEDSNERLEGFSRRNNIRLFGVPEAGKDDYLACSRLAAEVLNDAYGDVRRWSVSDMERAHRVGEKRADKPRTLIVKLFRWSDKMNILSNADARDRLRRKNIRVASDLTVRQVADLEKVRKMGKFGYFKGGRLVIADGPRARPSARRDTARATAALHPSPDHDHDRTRHTVNSRSPPAHRRHSSRPQREVQPSSPEAPSPRHPSPSPSPSKESPSDSRRQRSTQPVTHQRTYATVTRNRGNRSNRRPSLDRSREEGQRKQSVHSARADCDDTSGILTRARMQSSRSAAPTPRGRQSRIDSHLQSSRRDK